MALNDIASHFVTLVAIELAPGPTFLAIFTGGGLVIAFAALLRRFVRTQRNVIRVNRALSSLLVVGGSCTAFV